MILVCMYIKKIRFWVRPRPSLKNRKIYNAYDLMKDLILDDMDELNLEYRYDVGSDILMQITTSYMLMWDVKGRYMMGEEVYWNLFQKMSWRKHHALPITSTITRKSVNVPFVFVVYDAFFYQWTLWSHSQGVKIKV